MIGGWYGFTPEASFPVFGADEAYAKIKLGREYPAHLERSNRPEVVRELCDLLYRVAKLRPREIDRNPLGVSAERDDQSGAVDVFLFGGPCAGDEATIPTGRFTYRVPVFRREPLVSLWDMADQLSTRPTYDVARYTRRLDMCGLPVRGADGRQVFDFTSLEAA